MGGGWKVLGDLLSDSLSRPLFEAPNSAVSAHVPPALRPSSHHPTTRSSSPPPPAHELAAPRLPQPRVLGALGGGVNPWYRQVHEALERMGLFTALLSVYSFVLTSILAVAPSCIVTSYHLCIISFFFFLSFLYRYIDSFILSFSFYFFL